MDSIGGGGGGGISSMGGGDAPSRAPESSAPVESPSPAADSPSPATDSPTPGGTNEIDRTTLSDDLGDTTGLKADDLDHTRELAANYGAEPNPGLSEAPRDGGDAVGAEAPQATPPPEAPAAPSEGPNGLVGAPVRDKDMWSTPSSPWTTGPDGLQQRTWSAGDQNGPWTETRRADGTTDRSRSYSENGQNWRETISNDGHHWRYREGGFDGLRAEAAGKGSTTIQVPGADGRPMDLKISGAPTPQEIERVRDSVMAMPPQARANARDISLSNDLGQIYSRGMNQQPISGVGGMAGTRDGSMVIDRNSLTSPEAANYLIHHEAGHNLQAASGYDVTNPVWSAIPGSVSDYGSNSREEDFADTHRYLMGNWDSYFNSGARLPPSSPNVSPPLSGINQTPSTTKAMEILRLYGWDPAFSN